ncbi:translation initiation factor 2 [Pseudomonas sp.]|uniref:translation initiation factor 2 n=1 Tax=Pseudomonas sp. TaxID=306 RepID=UPI003F3B25BE
MKPIFPVVCLSICLLMTVHAQGVMAASSQEKPAASSETAKKPAPVKKTAAVKKNTTPVKKKAAVVKKRPPVASKSKPASEVVKTRLPSVDLDLSLPQEMAEELKPLGTVPLPKRDAVLPQMFGDKSAPFQLNGRLISNEMQLQLRNEERREVEGAALEFEFKR